MTIPARGEEAYRAAFERLKRGTPARLPIGTPVSQNNVAKEAGCDPSALKKARFPDLVFEIQRWVAGGKRHDGQKRGRDPAKRAAQSERMEARATEVLAQRDAAVSALTEATARILELSQELERLRKKAS